jgi:hypothetical protein
MLPLTINATYDRSKLPRTMQSGRNESGRCTMYNVYTYRYKKSWTVRAHSLRLGAGEARHNGIQANKPGPSDQKGLEGTVEPEQSHTHPRYKLHVIRDCLLRKMTSAAISPYTFVGSNARQRRG